MTEADDKPSRMDANGSSPATAVNCRGLEVVVGYGDGDD